MSVKVSGLSDFKLGFVQMRQSVGSVWSNAAAILEVARQANEHGVELLVTSECALSGYMRLDSILDTGFSNEVRDALQFLASELFNLNPHFGLLLGSAFPVADHPDPSLSALGSLSSFDEGSAFFNSALLLQNDTVVPVASKRVLASYREFFEHRFFVQAPESVDAGLFKFSRANGSVLTLGALICAELWDAPGFRAKALEDAGADLVLSLNSSSFERGKASLRLDMLSDTVAGLQVPLLYVNHVGAFDGVVFDGGSVLLAPSSLYGDADDDASGGSEPLVVAASAFFSSVLGVVSFDRFGVPVSSRFVELDTLYPGSRDTSGSVLQFPLSSSFVPFLEEVVQLPYPVSQLRGLLPSPSDIWAVERGLLSSSEVLSNAVSRAKQVVPFSSSSAVSSDVSFDVELALLYDALRLGFFDFVLSGAALRLLSSDVSVSVSDAGVSVDVSRLLPWFVSRSASWFGELFDAVPSLLAGSSGGIDSALSLTLAVDTFGSSKVFSLALPGPFSSPKSLEAAYDLARNLDVALYSLDISDQFESFSSEFESMLANPVLQSSLSEGFASVPSGVTVENFQARLRMLSVMGFSNHANALMIATGNKSELFTGYCTLYGDLAGAFAPLADLLKTDVFVLSFWRNALVSSGFVSGSVPIPEFVLSRPPSAELAPGQVDEEALLPYLDLDRAVAAFVVHRMSVSEVAALTGLSVEVVESLRNKLLSSEFKRVQAPPLVKVSAVSFGSDRLARVSQV